MLEQLISPSDEVIAWVASAMQERHQDSIETNDQLTTSIQAQVDRLTRMDTNLYDDKLAGEILAERYEQKHTELMAEKAQLEERLSKIDQSLGVILEKKLVLLELSQKAAELYPKKTPEQKRTIITKLFQKLTYDNGVVSVNYTNFSRAIAQNVLKSHNLLGGTI
jgi:hypothetical protein